MNDSTQTTDYFNRSACNVKPNPLIDNSQSSQGKTLINSIFSSSTYNPKVIRPMSAPTKDTLIPKPTTNQIHLSESPSISPRPSSPRFPIPPQPPPPKSIRTSSKRSKRPRIRRSSPSNRQNPLKKFPYEKSKNHIHFSSIPIEPPSIKNSNKYYKFGVHLLFETNERKRAVFYLKKSADLGKPEAMSLYGRMLNDGDGVEKDEVEAARYLRCAADSGDIEAIRCYAMKCRTGSGVDFSLKESVRYFQMAADAGDLESAREIVKILDNGCSFLLGKRESAQYYKMLADNGDTEALNKYNAIISKLKK